jgi:Ca2+-transporting ATPase
MIVNVKKFIEYQLTINFSIVTIIGVTIATNKDSPFTFVQLLMINLLMDTFAAIALAYQNPRESINKLKFTIDKKDPLINSLMWSNILFQSGLITAISL